MVVVCSSVFVVFLGSVFCVSVASTKALAATGGQDDVAYVWNVLTGDTVFKCAGLLTLFVHF